MRHFKITSSNLFIIALSLVAGIVLLLFVFQERISLPIPLAFNQITPTLAPAVLVPTDNAEFTSESRLNSRPEFDDKTILDNIPFIETQFWDEFKESAETNDDVITYTKAARITRIITPKKIFEVTLINGTRSRLEIVDFVTVFDIPLYSRDSDRKIISFARKGAPSDSVKILKPGTNIIVTFKTSDQNLIVADRILFAD